MNRDEQVKEWVNTALTRYQNGEYIAGVDILRYISNGWIRGKASCAVECKIIFIEWFPNNSSYVWLRMAEKDYLEYNE